MTGVGVDPVRGRFVGKQAARKKHKCNREGAKSAKANAKMKPF
jgi:hypothetical protein